MTAVMVPLRVMVLDAWDNVAMDVSPETTLDTVKRRALEAARVMGPVGEFVVKFRGAEVHETHRTVADLGIPPDAALIVLRRGRPPVR